MIPQTYRCTCGQTNIRSAPHCGRANCQLPNPGLAAARGIDAQMARATTAETKKSKRNTDAQEST